MVIVLLGRCFLSLVFLLLTVLFGFQSAPFTILRVVAREVLDDTIALENEQMIHYLVHEVAVVADHDDTAGEVFEILLQHLQRLYVEVVGRLVKDKEVRIAHEHGAEVELAAFATAELVDIVVLLLRREHEIVEEL